MTSERQSPVRGQETDGSTVSGDDTGGSHAALTVFVANEHIRPAYQAAVSADPADPDEVAEQLRVAIDALEAGEYPERFGEPEVEQR